RQELVRGGDGRAARGWVLRERGEPRRRAGTDAAWRGEEERRAGPVAAHADARRAAVVPRGNGGPESHRVHDSLLQVAGLAAAGAVAAGKLAEDPRRRQPGQRAVAVQPHGGGVAAGPGAGAAREHRAVEGEDR